MKLNNKRIIRTALGKYERAMETKQFIFFVNFEESDENACVKMFDRVMNPISDNYFAYEAFFEEMRKRKLSQVTWKSKKLIESLKKRK